MPRSLLKLSINKEKPIIHLANFGDIPDKFKKQLESIEKYLSDDDLFKLHKFENSSRITVFRKERPYSINKKYKKIWMIALAVLFILYLLFSFKIFMILMITILALLSIKKPPLIVNKCHSIYRSSNVVEYSSKLVFDYLLDNYRKEVKCCSGRVVKDCKEEWVKPNNHTTLYKFQFEPAINDIKNMYAKPSEVKAEQYWCIDDNETRFILTQIEVKHPKTQASIIYEESFVVLSSPSQPGKCLIYFFTNLGCPGNFIYENISPKNMAISYLNEFDEYDGNIDEEVNDQNLDTTILSRNLLGSNGVKAKIIRENPIKEAQNVGNEVDSSNIVVDPRFSKLYNPRKRRSSANMQYKENPDNVKIIEGVRMGISERFIGYFRLEDGLLWCHNQEELSSQKGLIYDLLKRAGEKLMKGEGVVSISLPVRIFERRSALERCGDLWTTGVKYLTLAGQVSDPIERFKFVMCFMIGSMYMVCKQKKPFNPILGETFQGYWPDGTRIYIEHISHHPPISYFLVEHPDELYKFEGSYEYTAKLTNLGNSVTGRQVGKNRVHFPDGTIIEYEYPFLKINGLMFGKRTVEWDGSILFTDNKNNIECEVNFPEKGYFGLKENTEYDLMTGVIKHNDEPVCEVQGSWLSHLCFNNKIYWDLETSDIILPMPVENPLPSDCRFREDSIALCSGDMEFAQDEKERLEVLQRKDKKLRTEGRRDIEN